MKMTWDRWAERFGFEDALGYRFAQAENGKYRRCRIATVTLKEGARD